MDIWKWVRDVMNEYAEGEHYRLAYLMNSISSLACNDRHDEVDAVYPEALALAREVGNSWVELYLRHWRLQSLVLHRLDVSNALGEAVSLLEFAHRPENKDCPQAVCVTQDLAATYGGIDGRGYSAERIAVAEETLARINPIWPCFTCITSEKSSALNDAGRHQEALDFIEGQRRAIELEPKAEIRGYWSELSLDQIEALVRLERFDEALELCEESMKYITNDNQMVLRRLDMCRVLAMQGKTSEALEYLPDARTVWNTPSHYGRASEALFWLIRHGEIENDWNIGKLFWQMASRLAVQGVNRLTITVALRGLELALARQSTELSRRLIELIEVTATKLRSSDDLDDAIAMWRANVDAMLGSIEIPEEVFESLDSVQEHLNVSPERDLVVLIQASSRFPEAEAIHQAVVDLYQVIGLDDEALAHIARASAANPEVDALYNRLGLMLLDAGKTERFDAHVLALLGDDTASAPRRANATWLRANQALRCDDWSAAAGWLEQTLELDPGVRNSRVMLAMVYRQLERYDDALRVLDAQLKRFDEGAGEACHWERMLSATLAKRWSVLRESSAALGWEFEGEQDEPIDQPFARCVIVREGEAGQPEARRAIRISPVAARIVQLSPEGSAQQRGQVVVFDPGPLNPRSPDHPEDEPYIAQLRYVGEVEPATHHATFGVDGVRPPNEQLEPIFTALADAGVELEIANPDEYVLTDQEGVQHLGFYARVSTHRDVSLLTLHEVLAAVTRTHDLRWVWVGLCEALIESGQVQLAEDLRGQRALVEELDINL